MVKVWSLIGVHYDNSNSHIVNEIFNWTSQMVLWICILRRQNQMKKYSAQTKRATLAITNNHAMYT